MRLRDDESSSAPFDLLISTADDDESTAQSSGTAQSGGDGTVLAVFLRVTNASLLTQPSYTIHDTRANPHTIIIIITVIIIIIIIKLLPSVL